MCVHVKEQENWTVYLVIIPIRFKSICSYTYAINMFLPIHIITQETIRSAANSLYSNHECMVWISFSYYNIPIVCTGDVGINEKVCLPYQSIYSCYRTRSYLVDAVCLLLIYIIHTDTNTV